MLFLLRLVKSPVPLGWCAGALRRNWACHVALASRRRSVVSVGATLGELVGDLGLLCALG